MPNKSPEEKAIEKRIKEEQKIDRDAARRERATQIVAAARFVGDFRILDPDAETVLKAALGKFNGNDSNYVTVDEADVPKQLHSSLALDAEKLQQYGMISQYMIYGRSVMMIISTAGMNYFEKKQSAEASSNKAVGTFMRDSIFISHRTVDAGVADMILDFLVACDIPREKIFCSSLPGNDVDEQISPEVKQRLKEATIIILILSKAYYESVYCINEAGVAWYLDDVKAIPFGLPEISHGDMVGFLNSDYNLRRLDSEGDIS